MTRKRSNLRQFAVLLTAICLLIGCLPASPPTPTSSPAISASSTALIPATTPTPPHTPTFVPPSPTPFHSPTPSISPTPAIQPASVRVSMADVWDDPTNENSYWHRQTQLVTGEHILITFQRADWAQIIAVEQPSSKHPLGYPGWVRSSLLAPGWLSAPSFAVVMAKSSSLRDMPNSNSRIIFPVYLDTRLAVLSQQANWIQVILPGGENAWIARSDVRLAAAREDTALLDRFFDLAKSFASTPYLWGGTTLPQLDCSGFTYRLFHAFGIQLARDSQDQALYGSPVDFDFSQPLDSPLLKRGDLLFFTQQTGGTVTHVGVAWGNGFILDAKAGSGITLHSLVDMKAGYFFHSARRIADFSQK